MRSFRSLLCLGLVSCIDVPPRTAADSQAVHVQAVVDAGGVVDSLRPIEEHLARFRRGLHRPRSLAGTFESKERLAEAFLQAVADVDTSRLNELVLSRAEFAWIFYPHTLLSKPPYEAPPQLLWGQLLASSNEGIRAVLRRYGGHSLTLRALHCPDSITIEGPNRLIGVCTMDFEDNGILRERQQLFGTILEHDGRVKLVSLASRF